LYEDTEFAAILAVLGIIALIVTACDNGITGGNNNGGTDPALNETCIVTGSSWERNNNNGSFETSNNGISDLKGTYTTNSGKITSKTTQAWGKCFSDSLDAKWYTKSELQSALDVSYHDQIEASFEEETLFYSINGNTVTLTSENNTYIWTRKESGNNNNNNGNVSDGPTWQGSYTDGSAATIILTFKGSNFTVTFPSGEPMNGTYTLSGNTVTMNFINGNVSTATLVGNTLLINGVDVTFTKQENNNNNNNDGTFTYAEEENGTITITGYQGKIPSSLNIPAQINEKPVTTIGEYAFRYADFTSVTIPNSVTSIGSRSLLDLA